MLPERSISSEFFKRFSSFCSTIFKVLLTALNSKTSLPNEKNSLVKCNISNVRFDCLRKNSAFKEILLKSETSLNNGDLRNWNLLSFCFEVCKGFKEFWINEIQKTVANVKILELNEVLECVNADKLDPVGRENQYEKNR